jgi:hypothetical protein
MVKTSKVKGEAAATRNYLSRFIFQFSLEFVVPAQSHYAGSQIEVVDPLKSRLFYHHVSSSWDGCIRIGSAR